MRPPSSSGRCREKGISGSLVSVSEFAREGTFRNKTETTSPVPQTIQTLIINLFFYTLIHFNLQNFCLQIILFGGSIIHNQGNFGTQKMCSAVERWCGLPWKWARVPTKPGARHRRVPPKASLVP